MGKPDRGNARPPYGEYIAVSEQTRGSETSQYPQEEKSTEIPSVAASERGRAQTVGSDTHGVVGLLRGIPGELSNRCVAEGAWKGQPERVIVP
jgi:hypothetical protein